MPTNPLRFAAVHARFAEREVSRRGFTRRLDQAEIAFVTNLIARGGHDDEEISQLLWELRHGTPINPPQGGF